MVKMDIFKLAEELKKRGLTAETFNNGLHWRIKSKHIDLYPTTGNWKWMSQKTRGTLEDFVKFLDEIEEKERLLSSVVTRIN